MDGGSVNDDQNTGSKDTAVSSIPVVRTGKRWLFIGLLLFLLAAIAIVLIWTNRNSIAERYLTNWCAEQGITCSAHFAELNLDKVQLHDVEVRSGGEVPVVIGRLTILTQWPEFFKPVVTEVRADGPILRASMAEGELSFYGLEDLFADNSADEDSGAKPIEVPELNITNGRLHLATVAGDLNGQFELVGKPLAHGTANLSIDPVELQSGDNIVKTSAADLSLIFQDSALVGSVELVLDRVISEGAIVENAIIQADLAEQGDQIALEMRGRLDKYRSDEFNADAVMLVASAGLLKIEEFSPQALLNALGQTSVHVNAENIAAADTALSSAEFNGELNRSARGGLEGPVALQAKNVAFEMGTAGQLGVSGDTYIDLHNKERFEFVGDVTVQQGKVSPGIREPLVAMLDLPEPATSHARQMRRAVGNALGDFDVGLRLDGKVEGEAWSLVAHRPTAFQSASGLKISIDPGGDDQWLGLEPNKIDLSGKVSVSGGGAPALETFIDLTSGAGAEDQLEFNNLILAPWRSNGVTVQADIPSLRLGLGSSVGIDVNGEVQVSGSVFGLEMQPTRLIGQVSAAEGREGWRVQTRDNSCIGFDTRGFAAGTLKVADTALSLCPVDGRFVRQENGQSVGQIMLGDLRVPFETGDASGELGVSNAALEWFAGDDIRLFVNGDNFSFPLQYSGEDLTISSVRPVVEVALNDGPARIKTTVGRTEFGGSMVPAHVVSDTFVFEASATSSGIAGTMNAERVHISDLNEDPIYQPLIAELSATLLDGVINLTGPIRTRAQGFEIADAQMNLHLADLDGTAQVRMRPLTFAKGAFQPVHLSELLRGVLINASGGMTGAADFDIRSGALSGSGYVDFADLIVDTFTVGTVSGINGRLNFSDVLNITTPPNQEITIDFMDPGIPLFDGKLGLQIIEGSTVKLEGLSWPFAGGDLVVLPTVFEADMSIDEVETIIVEARLLELANLIEVLQVPDLKATGTVSGRFPVDIDGVNILIRDATLEADSKGGTLSYTGSAASAVTGQNTFVDFAVEAVKELDYSVMKIGANGNLVGDIVVTAELLGRNADVLGGAEFRFGVSVDSPLSNLIHSASNASRETYVAEAIKLRDEKAAADLE